TAIGVGVGSAIIAIGLASLFLNFGIQTIEVDETFGLGEATTYRISAPAHTPQKMKITGDTFDVRLESPADGLQVPKTSQKGIKIRLGSFRRWRDKNPNSKYRKF
ncbi:hypothetical protein LCGC14_2058290, partial [marine sediment metagenome]